MHVNNLVHQIQKHSNNWISEETDFFTHFSEIAFFKKVTTDFENCAKRQAETKTCVFVYMDHKAIPYRASSVHFATANFHPFRTLPVWMQTIKISITRYSWEKNHSQKCCQKPLLMIQKNWKLRNYRTSRFFYTVARRNALTQSDVSPLHAIEIIVLLGHLTFVPLCRFHFRSDCIKISSAFEP